MAVYQLTSPKGEKYQVNAPDDASQDQVMQYFQQNSGHPDFTPAKPETSGQNAGRLLDATLSGAYAPFKPIVDNSLEALKNTATATGEAISEPLNSPSANGAISIPDAGIRLAGKAGNILAGTAGAVMSPLVGALSASTEPMIPTEAKGIAALTGQNPNLSPDQVHQLAMQQGGDLANAIMLGKSGLPRTQSTPAPTITDEPRASLLSSNSSDPMQAPAAPIYSTEDLKAASGGYYQKMRDAGASLNQSGINIVNDTINKSLKDSGLMNQRLHSDTLSVVDDLRKEMASGQVDLEKLDQYRQLLGDVVTDNTSKLDGMNKDAMKANVAIQAIDKAVDGLTPNEISNPAAVDSLNSARDLYSASARTRDMQRIVDNANMTDNPATAIKTGFRNLAKQVNANPRGYTPEEVQAINHAAKTGIVGGALKFGGSRIISSLAGAAGGATGGIPGSIAGAVTGGVLSTPMRMASNALQRGRAQTAIDMVSARPAVQAAMNPAPPIPQAPITPTAAAPYVEPTLQAIMAMRPDEAKAVLDKYLANRYQKQTN